MPSLKKRQKNEERKPTQTILHHSLSSVPIQDAAFIPFFLFHENPPSPFFPIFTPFSLSSFHNFVRHFVYLRPRDGDFFDLACLFSTQMERLQRERERDRVVGTSRPRNREGNWVEAAPPVIGGYEGSERILPLCLSLPEK